jgi:hypothetical protein
MTALEALAILKAATRKLPHARCRRPSKFAVPTFARGFDWYSRGIILRAARLGSIIEVKRIAGPIFHSKEAAEEHALQLCRDWIDKLALTLR